ncbi:hypothetical protein JCM10213v2_002608 [Rhodosporidiobolus nylandii]
MPPIVQVFRRSKPPRLPPVKNSEAIDARHAKEVRRGPWTQDRVDGHDERRRELARDEARVYGTDSRDQQFLDAQMRDWNTWAKREDSRNDLTDGSYRPSAELRHREELRWKHTVLPRLRLYVPPALPQPTDSEVDFNEHAWQARYRLDNLEREVQEERRLLAHALHGQEVLDRLAPINRQLVAREHELAQLNEATNDLAEVDKQLKLEQELDRLLAKEYYFHDAIRRQKEARLQENPHAPQPVDFGRAEHEADDQVNELIARHRGIEHLLENPSPLHEMVEQHHLRENTLPGRSHARRSASEDAANGRHSSTPYLSNGRYYTLVYARLYLQERHDLLRRLKDRGAERRHSGEHEYDNEAEYERLCLIQASLRDEFQAHPPRSGEQAHTMAENVTQRIRHLTTKERKAEFNKLPAAYHQGPGHTVYHEPTEMVHENYSSFSFPRREESGAPLPPPHTNLPQRRRVNSTHTDSSVTTIGSSILDPAGSSRNSQDGGHHSKRIRDYSPMPGPGEGGSEEVPTPLSPRSQPFVPEGRTAHYGNDLAAAHGLRTGHTLRPIVRQTGSSSDSLTALPPMPPPKNESGRPAIPPQVSSRKAWMSRVLRRSGSGSE